MSKDVENRIKEWGLNTMVGFIELLDDLQDIFVWSENEKAIEKSFFSRIF